MPIDPQTGEELPYAGEPGAAPGAPPRRTVVPARDLKPMLDRTDEIVAGLDEDTAAAAQAGGAPMEEGGPVEGEEELTEEAPVEGAADVTAIAETLGVDQEQAQKLYDAAQQIPRLAGISPEELAAMMADDFQLRMEVEKMAAGGEDMMAEEEESIEAPMPPPGPGGVL